MYGGSAIAGRGSFTNVNFLATQPSFRKKIDRGPITVVRVTGPRHYLKRTAERNVFTHRPTHREPSKCGGFALLVLARSFITFPDDPRRRRHPLADSGRTRRGGGGRRIDGTFI